MFRQLWLLGRNAKLNQFGEFRDLTVVILAHQLEK